MRLLKQLILALAAAATVGCAASQPATRPADTALNLPTTQPTDPRQWLTLAEVPNAPAMTPQTQPSDAPAPLGALLLYARAREAQLDDQREEATQLLEQACQIDPSSFELQYELARMYAAGGAAVSPDDSQALSALESAAKIEPDHLRLQIDLGRAYLQKTNFAAALTHFRLALQTSEYGNDDALAAVADFFLAGVLQRQGYLRAALDEFRLLVDRLHTPTMAMRGNSELGILLSHIDSFEGQIGELEERLEQYPQALATFEPLLANDPTNVPLTARVVACLLGCNRPADAVARAAHLVELHHGSTETVTVLNEACRGSLDLGSPADPAEQLHRLSSAHLADRGLFYAWIDSLHAQGQDGRALDALAVISASDPYDPQLLRRRFNLMRGSNNGSAEGAARMLIAEVAQYPALAEQLEPMWEQLLRPGRLPYLSLADLRAISVPRDQEQAKQFSLAVSAEVFGRQALAESALAQANASGGYAPAARLQMDIIWSAGDLTDTQKIQRSDDLASRADVAGNHGLAEELRGLVDSYQKQPTLAHFDTAIHAAPSPQLLLERALAIRDGAVYSQRGEDKQPTFESEMWKLLSDWPGFDPGYLALVNFYTAHEQDDPSVNVVRTWLSADPDNVTAQRVQAQQSLQSGRADMAQAVFSRLLETDDNDPEVLASAIALQAQNGPIDPMIDRLSTLAAREPRNLALAGQLAELYADQNRLQDAQRVLDATSAKLADNPDMLYELSGFYHRVGLSARSEQMLSQVLHLDPAYAGAANDLGYYWADASTNLPQAEALVRQAIAAEPHNTAFLDSLGWVLYKLGRYGEANGYLETAATPRQSADPVVLNHLGDVLYRMGQSQGADEAWETAAGKIPDTNEGEMKTLRASLRHKSQQLKANEPVDVAPISGAATRPATSALP
jgi:predicted Zn-dependent protease